MKIVQEFTVARPRPVIWAFFSDVPVVARCLPGAEITEDKGGGTYAGRVNVKLGPFGAAFEGEATVRPDPANWTGHVAGRGVDRKGGSRSRMVMDYRLTEIDGATKVTVEADITLAGPIAQFGRTGMIREASNILVRDFVASLEQWLAADAAAAPSTPRRIMGVRLAWKSLLAWLRNLFGR